MLWFDLIIAIAYFAIPLELVYCFWFYPFPIRTKPAVVGSLFVTFITLCGKYNNPIPDHDRILVGSWPKHTLLCLLAYPMTGNCRETEELKARVI